MHPAYEIRERHKPNAPPASDAEIKLRASQLR